MEDTSELIPHRGRWQIATRIVEFDGDRIVCEGDFDEDYVDGHFPDLPVVPGVALLEGLAQATLVLSRKRQPDASGVPFLAGFDRVRFRAPVHPPATVRFEVKLVEERASLTRTAGTVTWNGKRVCTAKLTGAVIPLDPADLERGNGGSSP